MQIFHTFPMHYLYGMHALSVSSDDLIYCSAMIFLQMETNKLWMLGDIKVVEICFNVKNLRLFYKHVYNSKHTSQVENDNTVIHFK